MNLRPKLPPAHVINAFTLGLSCACPAEQFTPQEFAPQHGYHLPIHSLGLKYVMTARDSIDDASAPHVAWQCLAVYAADPDRKALIGEVTPRLMSTRPAGQDLIGAVRMTSVTYGPVIDGAYQKARSLVATMYSGNKVAPKNARAGKAIQPPGGDYEPRMLRIPGLLVGACWLKSLNGGTDYVAPLHGRIKQLDQPLYAMRDFLKILRPFAKQRLTSQIFD